MKFGMFESNKNQLSPKQIRNTLNLSPTLEEDSDETKRSQDSEDEYLDRLANMQKIFNEKTHELDLDFAYWQKMKLAILSQGKIVEDEEANNQSTFLKQVTHFLNKVKGYFQLPSHYIKELHEQKKPDIQKLCDKVDNLSSQLQSKEPKTHSEINRIKVEICNANISIINLFQAMTNQINREIDYCLRFVNFAEKVTSTLVQYFVGFKIPVPMPQFDLGINQHYRMGLYNMIHKPMEAVYHSAVDAQGAMGRSRVELEKSPERGQPNRLSEASPFFQPAKVTRNKKESDIILALHRTNSAPILA